MDFCGCAYFFMRLLQGAFRITPDGITMNRAPTLEKVPNKAATVVVSALTAKQWGPPAFFGDASGWKAIFIYVGRPIPRATPESYRKTSKLCRPPTPTDEVYTCNALGKYRRYTYHLAYGYPGYIDNH